MRVIPVLDLMAGRAVRADRGLRVAYQPVASVLTPTVGDALALARAFREALSCDEWYVADLDAIAGRPPQRAILEALAGLGGKLMVDAAVASPEQARQTISDGAARVVVGLETLPAFQALAAIVRAVGRERVVFSLDLLSGRPVVLRGAPHQGEPFALVDQAIRAGAGAVIVLDLARVSTGSGVDLELVRRIRAAHPELELLAGGGVAGARDLGRLAEAGCDGALVATAVHDGGLRGSDLEVVRRRGAVAPRRGGHVSDSR